MNTILKNKAFVAKLTNCIASFEDEILTEWLNFAHIQDDDLYYEEIVKNGQQTIRLIIKYIQQPNNDFIVRLTKKIAAERIAADVNIGEFVYNINFGRSIVNKVIANSTLQEEDKMNGILVVDHLFDTYLYNAVKEYTSLKDEIIQKKNRFIQEMHNDRLTILGQIAASFAHEFRNPLTSIKGFIKLLEEKYAKENENNLYFEIINDEMDSLEDKVSQFLYLSKMKGLDDQMEKFNLSLVVERMIDFMYPRFLDVSIEVEKDIQKDCIVFGVEEQIKQVILNILNNAVEELSFIKYNRSISICLKKRGENLHLTISNNGPVIPKHFLEDIFQPFVTTKKLGVGLGLSVCKQIILKHHGEINVQSNDHQTTFEVDLKSYT